MNFFWKNAKVGIYNAKELRERLGLGNAQFNRLMELESERYARYVKKRHGSDYYAAKLAEDQLVAKYGGTPTFRPHPMRSASYVFNEESGVFLEKTWSRANKYNVGKDLPFGFTFEP